MIDINGTYFFKKDKPLILKDIELKENNIDGNYIFKNDNDNEIKKRISKTNLPNSTEMLKNLKNNDVFIKIKGELHVFKCNNIINKQILTT